jgi:DNA-binding MarR family transcriptional regulator
MLLTGLAKLGIALRHEAWKRGGRRGLTPTQSQVLVLLAREGGRRLGALAAELGVSAATASDAVSALVAKGLVRRTRARADARALALELSAAGRRESQRASQWPDAFLAAADELSGEEQAVLLRALTKMIRRLQLEGRIEVARMCASCRFFRPEAHPGTARPHHCDFVDAAFGDAELRLDCDDHEGAELELARLAYERFARREAGRS